jgi:hypothetical protein
MHQRPTALRRSRLIVVTTSGLTGRKLMSETIDGEFEKVVSLAGFRLRRAQDAKLDQQPLAAELATIKNEPGGAELAELLQTNPTTARTARNVIAGVSAAIEEGRERRESVTDIEVVAGVMIAAAMIIFRTAKEDRRLAVAEAAARFMLKHTAVLVAEDLKA